MAPDETVTPRQFILPIQIVSNVDVSRLLRELEVIEDFLREVNVRQPGTSVKLPITSRLLDDFTAQNKLNLLQTEDRTTASEFLTNLKDHAPTIHISFAADPSALFTGKIVTWLRNNIHPLLLLRIGLEPTIAAGCVVRTTNKMFDFSLRRHFLDQRPMLIEALSAKGDK